MVSIYVIKKDVEKEVQRTELPTQLFSTFTPALYPVVETPLVSTLSAQSAIILDNDSKIILFSKNPTTIYSMASTTKIMTALIALEYYKLDDTITIKSTDVPAAVVGYSLGEKIKFLDILYGMFLPSGNDAALAIAQNYPGGEEAFIMRMNEKAKELSLFNTNFNDSSGLDNGNRTTVGDLAQLTSVALQNPTIHKIVGTKEKITTNLEKSKIYNLTNINQLLGRYGVNGVKTGFTPDAGGVLVTSSNDNGHTVIYVVMKSEDRFGDTIKLLSTTFERIRYSTITP